MVYSHTDFMYVLGYAHAIELTEIKEDDAETKTTKFNNELNS